MLVQTNLLAAPIPFREEVYNGLDACVTFEVWEALRAMRPEPPEVYGFSRALQAPLLDIMLRGWKIDLEQRARSFVKVEAEIAYAQSALDEFAHEVWGKPLNARSPDQLRAFFYGRMGLPEQYKFDKGVRRVSTDRDSLEKLWNYFYPQPFLNCIFEIKDKGELLKVLAKEIEPDGRWRTSYNISPETFRLSSSASAFGTGSNTQNITPELRRMFVADEGWELCSLDREQAESREVGWQCWLLFRDGAYLDACESGDLHTQVAKMTWPELHWTGEPAPDRALAERPFYRHLSRRDMCKKLGHGSNYYGQPPTLARHAHIQIAMAKAFQERYFSAFPAIPRWHRWCAEQLQTRQYVENPFGVGRHFFGHPKDPVTLRELIAHIPQSATAIRTNLGMWRLWRHLPEVQLLGQGHDAVYFQFPRGEADKIVPRALELTSVPLSASNRTFDVPGEAKVGLNWAPASESNPSGLRKWRKK